MADVGSQGHLDTNSIVLISENFYNNMNIEHKDLSNYSKYCDAIKLRKNEREVKEICKKYIRYLETSTVLNVSKPDYNVCTLLNYWIYDKLSEIYRAEDSLYDINLAFGNLQFVWNKLYLYSGRTNHNNCKPEYETDNHEDWINRKKLYDYYVDYNYLISMAKSYQKECIYYKKIKEKHTVFDYFDRQCVSNTYKCPQFYYDFKSSNPKSVISTLPCHDQVDQARSGDPAHEKATRESSSHHSAHSGDGPGLKQLVDDPATKLEHVDSGIGRKVSHSVLGAAPVLLTATMLYRYTPLGPWIRKLRGINTNSMNTMDGFSPYTQETGDMFSDDSENYISYQPI
ncbi:unnamed protein product [Plasmodium vivax]|uniref:(malaria parasite P. vivax) hypothetical protein n=1 Tax=Plasmodium vivax TaxID=5855 RepID=A0A8S4H414_PLAVI|nr:unnamed protein product [Plasmodium vivax]